MPRKNQQTTHQSASFQFDAELNDFLSRDNTGKLIVYRFRGSPAIKDPIEVLGVPHTEVGSIRVNRQSVSFGYRLQPGDQVQVYPLDVVNQVVNQAKKPAGAPVEASHGTKQPAILRETLLTPVRFVVDSNLGKLARYLRLLGFDALYDNCYADAQVARISAETGRVILTRDRRLLMRRIIVHGAWSRSDHPDRQVGEVLHRFDLHPFIRPMARCAECNGLLEAVSKADVIDRLEPLTKRYYNQFYQCSDCGQIYWKGSHFDKLVRKLAVLAEKS